ncbi:alpha-amylase family glycosyl hydrolase, partial [Mycobacterium sp. 1081908.1]|uniref:alpha-amylase family glycosyl hydrolase n=1 Tax=Mycobacterium sp. 1081908.1 TaxID=1834066 RepID=UPI000A57B6A7
MALPVLSTYRLQLRGESSGFGFTFADAEGLLDYLDDLGVTHVYLSPLLTAARGSNHGYDVTDPTTVSPELGGPAGLARLSAAARARGMGLIVDIVPNHVGIDDPEQNAWWWDVLRHGRESRYAAFFDIDWDLDEDGRIVLPILGSDDDAADLKVDGDRLRLGDLALPIAPGTGQGSGPDVHDRQHYRLVGWRNGVCGYRRFFSITSLAGLRQEDRAVFDASHAEVARWFGEGLVDGEDLLDRDPRVGPEKLAQPRQISAGIGQSVGVVDAHAVDESLAEPAGDFGVAGVEHRAVFL